MEIRGDKLDFLDVTIMKNNKQFEFDWFHKPMFSGRYLNFILNILSLRSKARL